MYACFAISNGGGGTEILRCGFCFGFLGFGNEHLVRQPLAIGVFRRQLCCVGS